VGQPVHVTLDGSLVNLDSDGTNYFLQTAGGAQEVLSVDGVNVNDGDEITLTNNGPDDVVLRHNQGDAGKKLFLPGGQDRLLTATGKPYWMFRNRSGPLGDGWYDGEDPA
jgi:hypothetical protein